MTKSGRADDIASVAALEVDFWRNLLSLNLDDHLGLPLAVHLFRFERGGLPAETTTGTAIIVQRYTGGRVRYNRYLVPSLRARRSLMG